MKLLADENLPSRLVQDLADLFPESEHVNLAGLSGGSDEIIWEYAKSGGFVFITKDKDFANLSLVKGAPPKVILLQTGNCSTSDVLHIVRTNAIRLFEFSNDTQRSLLILR